MSEITGFFYPLSQTQLLCLSVLRLIRRRDQTRDGGGHFSAQLPVLPGSDPGLCGNGTSDLTGGRGSGSDVLCKPDVIRGLPVLLSLRGVPAAPPWGWAPRKRDPATVGAHLAKASLFTQPHTRTHMLKLTALELLHVSHWWALLLSESQTDRQALAATIVYVNTTNLFIQRVWTHAFSLNFCKWLWGFFVCVWLCTVLLCLALVPNSLSRLVLCSQIFIISLLCLVWCFEHL